MSGVVQKKSLESPAVSGDTAQLFPDKEDLRRVLEKQGLRPRRFLDDHDVAGILADVADGNVGGRRHRELMRSVANIDKAELKHEINSAIHRANMYVSVFVAPPLYEWIGRLEKVQRAIERARKALDESEDIRLALALELDGCPSRLLPCATLGKLHGMRINVLQAMSKLPVPSKEADAQVAQASTSINLLADWMAQLTASERKRSQKEKGADYLRFVLILGLAGVFKSTFGMAAAKTRNGPGHRFLAAALSRCEDKKIGLAGVWDSWGDARAWRKTVSGSRFASG